VHHQPAMAQKDIAPKIREMQFIDADEQIKSGG
jgi:hypothetical protein